MINSYDNESVLKIPFTLNQRSKRDMLALFMAKSSTKQTPACKFNSFSAYQEFPDFDRTRRFLTVFITACP